MPPRKPAKAAPKKPAAKAPGPAAVKDAAKAAAKDAAKATDPLVGKPAPEVALYDQDDKPLSLRAFRGQPVVLYFYPKDMTSGCTAQSCEYNDALPRYEALGAKVFGVSPDDAASHRAFIAKHGLRFPLLFDPSRKALEAFGVWQEKSMYGRTYMGVVRSTFVLDEEGRVEVAWRKVSPEGDAARVLDYLKQRQA